MEILYKVSLVSIKAMTLNLQLHWTGHVLRMSSSGVPRHLFYGVLSEGQRNTRYPKKLFKDCVKVRLLPASEPVNKTELDGAIQSEACANFESSRRDKTVCAISAVNHIEASSVS